MDEENSKPRQARQQKEGVQERDPYQANPSGAKERAPAWPQIESMLIGV
jgi:hypothetical protein